MSYFSDENELLADGIEFDEDVNPDLLGGCVEPLYAYGETPGVEPYEVAVAEGIITEVPEDEWPERIEHLDKTRTSLQHRLDADLDRPMTQGRLRYCAAYSVGGGMMICDARDGIKPKHLASARLAAIQKRGRDEGGWPIEYAVLAQEIGTCAEENWRDCRCSGKFCKGTRGGCQARDLSRVEETKAEAKLRRVDRFFELPRDSWKPTISALLSDCPVAAGWVRTGAWCDGHAMALTRPVRTSRRGFGLVPENSWGKYKRRLVVNRPPRGGVVIVSTVAYDDE